MGQAPVGPGVIARSRSTSGFEWSGRGHVTGDIPVMVATWWACSRQRGTAFDGYVPVTQLWG